MRHGQSVESKKMEVFGNMRLGFYAGLPKPTFFLHPNFSHMTTFLYPIPHTKVLSATKANGAAGTIFAQRVSQQGQEDVFDLDGRHS